MEREGPDNFALFSSAVNLNITPIELGKYAVSLTVTDSSGAAVTTNSGFTVTHGAPVPMIQNAPGTGLSGSTLTVNLTASIPDPGGDDTFTYAWAAIGGADNLFAANNSIVFGGGGNDTLTASGISDATLMAGSSNVILSATSASNLKQFGGSGNDSLYSS